MLQNEPLHLYPTVRARLFDMDALRSLRALYRWRGSRPSQAGAVPPSPSGAPSQSDAAGGADADVGASDAADISDVAGAPGEAHAVDQSPPDELVIVREMAHEILLVLLTSPSAGILHPATDTCFPFRFASVSL